MFSVWSVVREDMPTEEREREGKRERERQTAAARMHIHIRDLYDRMHTKIRYTEGLGSVSLRVA